MQFENRIPRHRSAELFEEAKSYFPGGVNSPVRAFKSVSGPPLFIREGHGCRIIDEDGNIYLDFCCSWGPLIHGHDHPHIRQAAVEAINKGTSFGTPTALGNQFGQLIVDHHPYIDKVRFVSSGTEAVMSAIRLARGYTGKSKVIKFEGCYHGHVDSLLVKAGSGLATFGTATSAGIPPSFVGETIVLPLDDRDLLEETLQQHAHDTACIIVEPVPANNGLLLQEPSFLQCLRLKAYKHQVLLIFDEVISGYRVGPAGAAGYYQVRPDIITFGKIIGGGFPVGAYAASADIMASVAPEGPVYQAGTLSANPVAMAAGHAAIQQCLAPGFYESLEQKTRRFVGHVQEYVDRKGYDLSIPHIGSIFWVCFSREHIRRADQIDPARMELFKLLHHELLQRGVYLGPSGYEVGFISAAHTDLDLDEAAAKVCQSLDVVFENIEVTSQ